MKAPVQMRAIWVVAGLSAVSLAFGAAKKDFWVHKDPAAWSSEEKQLLLNQSPWAHAGYVLMDVEKRPQGPTGPPPTLQAPRPGVQPGNDHSVPIGEKVPPAPDPNAARPLQFPAMARWESAKPVRLAGGPEIPDFDGRFYVIRLRGLPIMPPPKAEAVAPASDPNEGLLRALKAGARLVRRDKPDIPCARLFTGSGSESREALLYFPRGSDPIAEEDRMVTLECRFERFRFSMKFPLAEMMYKGELAL
jgi:hypothetical protein